MRDANRTDLPAALIVAVGLIGTLATASNASAQSSGSDAKPDRSIRTESSPKQEGDKPEAFYAQVERAKEFYAQKKYDRAVRHFKKAHSIAPTPNILYNIGLVYERKGELEKAVAYYEKFVRSPEVSLDLRRKAQERLEVLGSIVEKEDDDESADDDQPSNETASTEEKTETATSSGSTDDEETGRDEAEPPPTTDSSTTRADSGGGNAAGWVTVGLGGASLAAGGVFAFLSERAKDDFDTASTPGAKRSARDEAFRNVIIADSLLVTGGALAVTGTVLLLTNKKESGTRQVRLFPRLGRDMAGIGLSAEF